VAGIIPLLNLSNLEYDLPYDPWMLPTSETTTIIENAINSCAMAGCTDIWIVAPNFIHPMLKKIFGDAILSPRIYTNAIEIKKKNAKTGFRTAFHANKRIIPLFYIQLEPDDMIYNANTAFSILYASYIPSRLIKNFSNYALPDMFYVHPPFTVNDPNELKQVSHFKRLDKANFGELLCITDGEKNAANGYQLPFAYHLNSLERMHENYKNSKEKTVQNMLKGIDYKNFEISWHHDLRNWEDYCSFLMNKERRKKTVLKRRLLNNQVLNRIGKE